MIKIVVDTRSTLRHLEKQQKQVRYAAAVAITKTGKAVEKQLQTEMQQQFDRPTPWVAKGTFTRPATKANLTAVVGMKDRQALYTKEHFISGRRGMKPYEVVLRGLGVLPDSYRTVPGAGLKLDARGNPSRAQLREIIGSLKSRMGRFGKRGKSTYLVGYFVIQPGDASHLAPGIWRRVNNRAITPVLIFVSAATYRKRLDLKRLAQQVVAKEFRVIFAAEFNKALSTAR
jgi:hypothetical protein